MRRHRFKEKSKKNFHRKNPSEHAFKRILVVTEGSKTEVNYLKRLTEEVHAPTANVEVTGESGSSPDKVLDFAVAFFKKDPDFDYVYIVIDRDSHEKYDDTIKKVISLNNGDQGKNSAKKYRFRIISSVPCFELWIILHYKSTSRPYTSPQPGGSPAKELIKDLKKKVPSLAQYNKSNCDYYDDIQPLREEAVKRAKSLLSSVSSTGEKEHHENPSTRMHILVEDIQLLAKKKLV